MSSLSQPTSRTVLSSKHIPSSYTPAIVISSTDECIIQYQQSIQYISLQSHSHIDRQIEYVIDTNINAVTANQSHSNKQFGIAEHSQFTTALPHCIKQCRFSGIGLHNDINTSLICILTTTYHIYILSPYNEQRRIELLLDLTPYTLHDAQNPLCQTSICCDWLPYTIPHKQHQYTYIAIGNKCSNVSVYRVLLPITSTSIPEHIAYISCDSVADDPCWINTIVFNSHYKYTNTNIAQLSVSTTNGDIRIYDLQYSANNDTYNFQSIHYIPAIDNTLSSASNIQWYVHNNSTYLMHSIRSTLYAHNIDTNQQYHYDSTEYDDITSIQYIHALNNPAIITSHLNGTINRFTLTNQQLILDVTYSPTQFNDSKIVDSPLTGQYGIALSNDKLCLLSLYRTSDVLNKHGAAIRQTMLQLTPTLLCIEYMKSASVAVYSSERPDISPHQYNVPYNKQNQFATTNTNILSNGNKRFKPDSTDTDQIRDTSHQSFISTTPVSNGIPNRTHALRVGGSRLDAAKQILRSIEENQQHAQSHVIPQDTSSFDLTRQQYQTTIIQHVLHQVSLQHVHAYNFYTIQQCILHACFYVPNIDNTGNTASDNIQFSTVYSSTINQLHGNNKIFDTPITAANWYNFQRTALVEYVHIADVLIQQIQQLVQSYLTQYNISTGASCPIDTSVHQLQYGSILCYIASSLQAPFVTCTSTQQQLIYQYKSALQTYLSANMVLHALQLVQQQNQIDSSKQLTTLLMCDWILQRPKLHTIHILNLIQNCYKRFNCITELNVVSDYLTTATDTKQLVNLLYAVIKPTPSNTPHVNTIQIPAREHCYICNIPVQFTGLSRETCINNHKLVRCTRTFQLCSTATAVYRCSNCIANVNVSTNNIYQCPIDNCFLIKAHNA